MDFTTKQLEQYHKLVKEISIKRYEQNEYRSILDSLYNSIFTQEVFPQRDTYINEEHNVRADS